MPFLPVEEEEGGEKHDKDGDEKTPSSSNDDCGGIGGTEVVEEGGGVWKLLRVPVEWRTRREEAREEAEVEGEEEERGEGGDAEEEAGGNIMEAECSLSPLPVVACTTVSPPLLAPIAPSSTKAIPVSFVIKQAEGEDKGQKRERGEIKGEGEEEREQERRDDIGGGGRPRFRGQVDEEVFPWRVAEGRGNQKRAAVLSKSSTSTAKQATESRTDGRPLGGAADPPSPARPETSAVARLVKQKRSVGREPQKIHRGGPTFFNLTSRTSENLAPP